VSLTNLTATFNFQGSGTVTDPVSGTKQPVGFGSGPLPSRNMTFNYGTGANANAPAQVNANAWYCEPVTIAATSFGNLTLYGSLTDAQGNTLNFKYIRYIFIGIVGANGTLSFYVGPQNQTHAWGGAANMPWPGGVGATVYEQVWNTWELTHPFAGYTVDHTTPADVLGLYNPGAGSITLGVWIIGEQ
jgi:hypothetical protein